MSHHPWTWQSFHVIPDDNVYKVDKKLLSETQWNIDEHEIASALKWLRSKRVQSVISAMLDHRLILSLGRPQIRTYRHWF